MTQIFTEEKITIHFEFYICGRQLSTKFMRQFSNINRSHADAEGLHDVPQMQNIAPKKACNEGTTFTDIQGHYNCCC